MVNSAPFPARCDSLGGLLTRRDILQDANINDSQHIDRSGKFPGRSALCPGILPGRKVSPVVNCLPDRKLSRRIRPGRKVSRAGLVWKFSGLVYLACLIFTGAETMPPGRICRNSARISTRQTMHRLSTGSDSVHRFSPDLSTLENANLTCKLFRHWCSSPLQHPDTSNPECLTRPPSLYF